MTIPWWGWYLLGVVAGASVVVLANTVGVLLAMVRFDPSKVSPPSEDR